ncbi:hypothetical protein [Phyllobacterium zundukense]|uniref:hypothetical protein n=1 Tax=Phyllobacterium zundukense TaxID=1867719 RepID=UPI0010566277|nr:hypothetical protein [Phyllobacterium zundukense]
MDDQPVFGQMTRDGKTIGDTAASKNTYESGTLYRLPEGNRGSTVELLGAAGDAGWRNSEIIAAIIAVAEKNPAGARQIRRSVR